MTDERNKFDYIPEKGFEDFCKTVASKFGATLVELPEWRNFISFNKTKDTYDLHHRRQTSQVDRFGNKPKYQIYFKDLSLEAPYFLAEICKNEQGEETLGYVDYEYRYDCFPKVVCMAFDNTVPGETQEVYYSGVNLKRACNAMMAHIEKGKKAIKVY